MPWPYFFGETITVLDGSVTGTDDDGNDVRLYPPKYQLTNVAVAASDANAQQSNEYTNARDLVTIGLTLYGVPLDVEVLATDRVIARGKEWDVIGDSQDWISPYTGRVWGKVVPIGRREG